ncbi:MAG: trypsin-like serine protease [Oligoflexales bacterium]
MTTKAGLKIFSFVCLSTFLAHAISCKREEASEAKQFFENSSRRDPRDDEKLNILKLDLCTAFLVKNTSGKYFGMSAQHCLLGVKAAEWCASKPLLHSESGRGTFACKQVIASEPTRDIMIFELNLSSPGTNENVNAGLTLAGFVPAKDTRLKMIGYPADKFNNGKIQVTENCWIVKSPLPSPLMGALDDLSANHNCTTYGGNSGGPMLQEGTDVVIGLPFTYAPDVYTPNDALKTKSLAWLALVSDLVSKFRDKLVAEGIVILDSQDQKDLPGDYLPSGDYKTAPDAADTIYVIPSYLSAGELKFIKFVESFKKNAAEVKRFECSSGTCTSGSENITNIGKRSFTYKGAVYYYKGQKV